MTDSMQCTMRPATSYRGDWWEQSTMTSAPVWTSTPRETYNARHPVVAIRQKASRYGHRNSARTTPGEVPAAELRLLTVTITSIFQAGRGQTCLASTAAPGICSSSKSREWRANRTVGIVQPALEFYCEGRHQSAVGGSPKPRHPARPYPVRHRGPISSSPLFQFAIQIRCHQRKNR